MSIDCVYVWGIHLVSFDIPKRFPTKKRSALVPLEVFLAPYKAKSGLRVHVTLDMQLTAQNFRTTEEDTHFARSMDLAYTPEDHVPIRSAKVGRRAQASDGVAIRACIVDHNVRCVVRFYLGSKMLQAPLVNALIDFYMISAYRMNFNLIRIILCFDRQKQTLKPF